MNDLDDLLRDLVARITENTRRIGALETLEMPAHITVSIANVSNPPTDAELDTAFGTPAEVGAGFLALVDDNGVDTTVWLVGSSGTSWWYEGLTKAV